MFVLIYVEKTCGALIMVLHLIKARGYMSHARVAIREDLVITKHKHNYPTIYKDFFFRVVIVSTVEILSLYKKSVTFCRYHFGGHMRFFWGAVAMMGVETPRDLWDECSYFPEGNLHIKPYPSGA
jgi:hypothetical protein